MEGRVSELEAEAIQRLYEKIKDELQVAKIILFGSKARGEAGPYSDVDLLVLTYKERSKEDREKLSDIAADINIDYGVALSCLYYNIDDWQAGDSINPFLKDNVEREGVEVVLH
ncbi:nucleotidyltransferase family protein [Effusibacillus pohliae]|uniref:nucleotidyltransferase family protein n=1 Tax=Effusibacillus pohliae TaxID=232270 RepID=UPI000370F064|nr:nucleotidyltransferase domain-containing protein [Effusibacillus pohliae]